MSVDPKAFRDALGRFASGITVVAAEHGGERRGMTASAFLSVSVEPPLVLVSIAHKAHMHAVAAAAGRWTISLLSADQAAVSAHFAGRPDAALDPWAAMQGGEPVIAGALAWLACRHHELVDVGDHTLFIGRVEALEVFDGEPLVYFRARYRALAP